MPPIDCVVVGGGVAGLYAAWRLSSQASASTSSPRVSVFEHRSRLGGRIDTIKVGHSTARIELGAMRFWTSQQLVTSLLDELKIPIEDFPSDQEISSYFRGVHLRPQHYAQPANVPYRLRGAEIGMNAGALLGYALQQLAPEAGGSVTSDQLEVVAGRPDLARIGFWNALQSVLSSEAYKLLLAGMGERSALSNWHAGEAVRLMSFIAKSMQLKLQRPTQGFGSLIDALHTELTSRGVQVSTDRRLVRIERERTGTLSLVFQSHIGKIEKVAARTVILALPKRALERTFLRSYEALGSGHIQPLLKTVSVISAFKVYTSYKKPWWTDAWGQYGYTVTDLPIRQVYYGMGVGGSQADNQRILLTTYADAEESLFWTPLVRPTTASGKAGSPGHPVVAYVTALLQEVHDRWDLPDPEWWVCRDWGEEGGAWHAWKSGIDVPATMQKIRQPMPNVPIFICGEAYSRMQGWIEGALMSTEKMLEGAPFSLSRPAWLPADYDLGP